MKSELTYGHCFSRESMRFWASDSHQGLMDVQLLGESLIKDVK